MSNKLDISDSKDICLSVKIKRLGNNKFMFDVMKCELTEQEDIALQIFLQNMVIDKRYQKKELIPNFGDLNHG